MRKKFFTGVGLLLAGEILSALGIYEIAQIFNFQVLTWLCPLLNLAGEICIFIALAILFPCSKHFRIAFFINLGLAAVLSLTTLEDAVLLLYSNVGINNISVIEYFSYAYVPLESILRILIIYRILSGMSTYFYRLGDSKREYLGDKISRIFTSVLFVRICFYVISIIVERNTLNTVIPYICDIGALVALLVAHGVFIYYLIISTNEDFSY